MGMVFLTVTYKLPITAENTAVFYRGNFTEKSPDFFNVVEVSECFWTVPGQSGAELPIVICP